MKMNRTWLWLVGAILPITACGPARADRYITINLSYKIILNPADGSLPPKVSDENVDAYIGFMNDMLASYERGYRVARVGPVSHVGGVGDTTGPGKWYDKDVTNPPTVADDMISDALANPAAYAWNPNAINVYILHAAGQCEDVVDYIGQSFIFPMTDCVANGRYAQLAGIIEFFHVFHTQGASCNGICGNPGKTGDCYTTPGNDYVADTLPDLASWDQNAIADWTFHSPYGSLPPSQQSMVDDVYFNVMSYHGHFPCGHQVETPRLTEGQLDLLSDGTRPQANLVSGFAQIVARDGNAATGTGTSSEPFATVQAGVTAANAQGGDIVTIRPGAYDEKVYTSKPMVLRATRAGQVIIGSSVYPAAPPPVEVLPPEASYEAHRAANLSSPSLIPKAS